MRICVLGWHGMPHVRRWARFFATRGHEVAVVTCGGANARDVDEHGAPLPRAYDVHELGVPRAGKPGYLMKAPHARRLVRELGPDVVHAHTATSYGLLALASGARPLAVTTHGSDILISSRTALLRPFVRRVLRGADLVSVPGEHMRQRVEELRGREDGVVVLQYGVETERLAALGRSLRADRTDERVRLVTARPLTRLYNTDVVLRACAELDLDWRLDVAGDGPERANLETLAGELDVSDRVTFHGRVDEHSAEALVGRADVYLSMARSDGVSIALLEALALGARPVLADIAANRAWVDDGVDGILSQPDPDAVTSAIRRALSLDADRARESALGRVRERADREANLTAFEALLEGLVESARVSR
jgi:L-malate glycosyltransferase